MKTFKYMRIIPEHFEETEIDEYTLRAERRFQEGRRDRIAGLPCLANDGIYLNGWYSPEKDCYYIPKEALHLLKSL